TTAAAHPATRWAAPSAPPRAYRSTSPWSGTSTRTATSPAPPRTSTPRTTTSTGPTDEHHHRRLRDGHLGPRRPPEPEPGHRHLGPAAVDPPARAGAHP